jgi:hypothetical protein
MIDSAAQLVHIEEEDILRILPQDIDVAMSLCPQPQTDSVKAVQKEGSPKKIPRPPNAFILYRQHFHPFVKGENPSLQNNDICEFNLTLISHI